VFCLFEKFRVSDEAINQQGLGLGLSVSQMIAKKLKGGIFLKRS
jgi:signal transduction histidine kinase